MKKVFLLIMVFVTATITVNAQSAGGIVQTSGANATYVIDQNSTQPRYGGHSIGPYHGIGLGNDWALMDGLYANLNINCVDNATWSVNLINQDFNVYAFNDMYQRPVSSGTTGMFVIRFKQMIPYGQFRIVDFRFSDNSIINIIFKSYPDVIGSK